MTATATLDEILALARAGGATLAGLVSVEAVLGGASAIGQPALRFPPGARSVLVLGLAHPPREPELDWWGGPGGTPGNRILRRTARSLKRSFSEDLGLVTWVLPYHVEKGGLFLKDAAVLAGLGVMGVNNLVITPELGPRVRWKAMLLDLEVGEGTTGSEEEAFDPCSDCGRPCVHACPQRAFAKGRYDRKRCDVQMLRDEAKATPSIREGAEASERTVRYCRNCEQSCPVGTLT